MQQKTSPLLRSINPKDSLRDVSIERQLAKFDHPDVLVRTMAYYSIRQMIPLRFDSSHVHQVCQSLETATPGRQRSIQASNESPKLVKGEFDCVLTGILLSKIASYIPERQWSSKLAGKIVRALRDDLYFVDENYRQHDSTLIIYPLYFWKILPDEFRYLANSNAFAHEIVDTFLDDQKSLYIVHSALNQQIQNKDNQVKRLEDWHSALSTCYLGDRERHLMERLSHVVTPVIHERRQNKP